MTIQWQSWGSLLAVFAITATAAIHTSAAPVRDRHVEAEIVTAVSAFVPGQPVPAALRLKHDPNWHTYWKSSSTGYATSIHWELPEGFRAHELQWPVPRVYQLDFIVDYVFEGEVWLPFSIETPAQAEVGRSYRLGAQVEWLMCEKVCIPGKASLELNLLAATSAEEDPARAAAILQALRQLPVRLPAYTASAEKRGPTWTLVVSGPQPFRSTAGAYFFSDNAAVMAEKEQNVALDDKGRLVFTLSASEHSDPQLPGLSGVVVLAEGFGPDRHPALQIDTTNPTPALSSPPKPSSTSARTRSSPSLGLLLFYAFLGGMILNLMPCVFPVLGIKITGFVQQAGADKAKVALHGLVFTIGVLLSFWILVAFLLLFKTLGSQVGWGFQLQHPEFVFGMAVFLLLFALNLYGVFEIGQSAVAVGGSLPNRSGLVGSFFSGVLATVVATPCSAPFLGTAMGAALARSNIEIFFIFSVIAFGLSFPYLLLSLFPRAVDVLPRPGSWMETFKQCMSFLLFGTVAWLVWVLTGQMTEEAGFGSQDLLKTLWALVLVAMAGWIYGRYTPIHLEPRTRRIGLFVSLALFSTALLLGLPRADEELRTRMTEKKRLSAQGNEPAALLPAISGESRSVHWETWRPGLPEKLAAQGHTVFVDFTAKWCATCQTNKAALFSSPEVIALFREQKIIALKADWTSRDSLIAEELARFQKAAVPFNLIYLPGSTEPRQLPELLTPSAVLDVFRP